jgi:transcriptional regulator with XRE-family HTH domain
MSNLQTIREQMLMSKAELARRSGLSALTISRIEEGLACRVDTMRKILFALGLSINDKDRVFGDCNAVEKH